MLCRMEVFYLGGWVVENSLRRIQQPSWSTGSQFSANFPCNFIKTAKLEKALLVVSVLFTYMGRIKIEGLDSDVESTPIFVQAYNDTRWKAQYSPKTSPTPRKFVSRGGTVFPSYVLPESPTHPYLQYPSCPPSPETTPQELSPIHKVSLNSF